MAKSKGVSHILPVGLLRGWEVAEAPVSHGAAQKMRRSLSVLNK